MLYAIEALFLEMNIHLVLLVGFRVRWLLMDHCSTGATSPEKSPGQGRGDWPVKETFINKEGIQCTR